MRRSEQPPLDDTDASEHTADIRYAENYNRRHRIANKLVATAVLLDLLYLGAYKTPVVIEQLRLSGTEPSLSYISDSSHHPSAETIVVGGYGVKNSSPIAEALPQLGEIGSVFALEQDNRGIDAHVIAQMIIKQANQRGITEIGFFGDSNGGHLVTKIAREIQQDNSLLKVRFIVLDCIPTSVNSLRPDKKQSIDTLLWADNSWISWLFPDITSHPLLTYLSSQQKLSTTHSDSSLSLQHILDNAYAPSTPSSTLLAAEALQVVNNSLASDLDAIASVKNKNPPLIIETRPESNTADTTVISSIADRELVEMVDHAGLTLLKISLKDIVHGDPTANREQYQIAIKNIIIPSLKTYDQFITTSLHQHDSSWLSTQF